MLHNPRICVISVTGNCLCSITIIKVQSTFLPAILPNIHRFKKLFFAGRLSNKFVKTWSLQTSHLICVATLPCDLPLITTLVWECRLFSDINVLQGSVARRKTYGGFLNNHFIANFLENLSVKTLWKSVWWSYCHEFGVSLFMGRGVE